ncbi:MAG: hypothetical protein QM523_10145 [Candidatus Pacebacteria bacterium]|nr:hypothetical protein [Candidatus Paceibacterota bacterium]
MAQTLLKDRDVPVRHSARADRDIYPISKNIPNAETIKAIEETLASKNRYSFNSVAEMNEFLKRAVLEDE